MSYIFFVWSWIVHRGKQRCVMFKSFLIPNDYMYFSRLEFHLILSASSVDKQSKACCSSLQSIFFLSFFKYCADKDFFLDQTLVRLSWALFLTRPTPWPFISILFLLDLHSPVLGKILLSQFRENTSTTDVWYPLISDQVPHAPPLICKSFVCL